MSEHIHTLLITAPGFLSIRLDSEKVDGKSFRINLVIPENNEKFVVELSNGALTNIAGFQADDADLSITINRADLEKSMMGAVTFDEQIGSGCAQLRGSRKPFEQLKTMLVHFDLGYEIMPGSAVELTPEQEAFEQEAFEQEAFEQEAIGRSDGG